MKGAVLIKFISNDDDNNDNYHYLNWLLIYELYIMMEM